MIGECEPPGLTKDMMLTLTCKDRLVEGEGGIKSECSTPCGSLMVNTTKRSMFVTGDSSGQGHRRKAFRLVD